MFKRKPGKHRATKITFHETPDKNTRLDILVGGEHPHWEVFSVNLSIEEIVRTLKEADKNKKESEK